MRSFEIQYQLYKMHILHNFRIQSISIYLQLYNYHHNFILEYWRDFSLKNSSKINSWTSSLPPAKVREIRTKLHCRFRLNDNHTLNESMWHSISAQRHASNVVLFPFVLLKLDDSII